MAFKAFIINALCKWVIWVELVAFAVVDEISKSVVAI